MDRVLRFHPEGLTELEEVGESLGRVFADAMKEKLEELPSLPYAWPAWPGLAHVRRRVLSKWPYSIIYAIDDVSVLLIALAHYKRRPGYWLPRL